MQRKSTLAYDSMGTTARSGAAQASRRRRLDARPTSEAPPRSAPSSTPPSGLRLVQPASVPRPKMSSIPPEPTSIRALVARVALPRPAPVPRIVPPRLDDEAEALDDADLTFVEDVAPAPTRAPLPPVPWTAESTPVPANRTAPTTPPPRPAAPSADVATTEASVAAPPDGAVAIEATPVAAAFEAAPAPRWIAPAPVATTVADDDDALPPLSPLATLRARALAAWSAASPRTRGAITFAAGFVAGGAVVAGL